MTAEQHVAHRSLVLTIRGYAKREGAARAIAAFLEAIEGVETPTEPRRASAVAAVLTSAAKER